MAVMLVSALCIYANRQGDCSGICALFSGCRVNIAAEAGAVLRGGTAARDMAQRGGMLLSLGARSPIPWALSKHRRARARPRACTAWTLLMARL